MEGPGGEEVLALVPGCSAKWGPGALMPEDSERPSHSRRARRSYLITYFQFGFRKKKSAMTKVFFWKEKCLSLPFSPSYAGVKNFPETSLNVPSLSTHLQDLSYCLQYQILRKSSSEGAISHDGMGEQRHEKADYLVTRVGNTGLRLEGTLDTGYHQLILICYSMFTSGFHFEVCVREGLGTCMFLCA